MLDDFISRYLDYTANNESPAIYHRWAILTGLAAYLNHTAYLKQGHFNVNPNLYTILVGAPGTKKNTAINIARKLLKKADYSYFAPSKTTKEKFFLDLGEQDKESDTFLDDIATTTLFGGIDSSKITKTFIMSGEFETFFGNNILDFVKDLGELWDWEGTFESKIKNGKSVWINNPCVNIIGGITPEGLSNTFPPQMIGQGFFSRCLFIWGEKTRAKITFPKEEDENQTSELAAELKSFLPSIRTKLDYTEGAKKLIDKIYHTPESLQDPRFLTYYNRRLTQLFKLIIICTVVLRQREVTEQAVIYANTILSHAEQFMPKALGEFGKAKNSDVSHKVLSVIQAAKGVVTFQQIWAQVHQDLEKLQDLVTIVQNLAEAGKIQSITKTQGGGQGGFLPKHKIIEFTDSSTVDFSLLTEEERKMKL
jgi:hypothetical protein